MTPPCQADASRARHALRRCAAYSAPMTDGMFRYTLPGKASHGPALSVTFVTAHMFPSNARSVHRRDEIVSSVYCAHDGRFLRRRTGKSSLEPNLHSRQLRVDRPCCACMRAWFALKEIIGWHSPGSLLHNQIRMLQAKCFSTRMPAHQYSQVSSESNMFNKEEQRRPR